MSRSYSKKAMAERATESRAQTCSIGRIITPPASSAYIKNYDRIFRKKTILPKKLINHLAREMRKERDRQIVKAVNESIGKRKGQ